ncbi:MAG: tRNA 2-thiouridine(34) synthase MnmA [Aquificaceae bacterium]|nr:tRNA 2-thiouridine(34) synthase MnmA [Aquificaceae bacterium]MDW8237708.1 tRNA 2-thiouridine(34) synthase MnmA [Aquificaceae bacterium]
MKIAVGMSGGVDSTACALLMSRVGHEVIGITLRFHKICDGERVCCSPQDVKDASRVANLLGISHLVIDWEELFRQRVVDRFLGFSSRGKTLNPCAVCNRDVKTGFLARYLRDVAMIDRLATGHYARIVDFKSFRVIARAKDRAKDQSYFLALLRAEDIELLEFPLGDMTKDEIRELLRSEGIDIWDKRDSQDVCFFMGKSLSEYLEENIGAIEGELVFENRVLARHSSIFSLTIGQRKGLGVAFGEALYVKEIDPCAKRVLLSKKEELYKSEIELESLSLHLPISQWGKVFAQVRYRGELSEVEDIIQTNGGTLVRFKKPVWAPAPGQVCAFYEGDVLLGGGIIAR